MDKITHKEGESPENSPSKEVKIEIHTGGGAFIYGNVTTEGGNFTGRDQTTGTNGYRPPANGGPSTVPQRPKASHDTLPPNPFTDTLAIRDPLRFVGRSREMDKLRLLLQGGSVALLGEPKIGKSSLLWQLKATWPGKVIGPIDCLALEDHDDFYACLAEALLLESVDWRSIRKALANLSALLILDELDAGPQHGITYEDLGRLRAVCGDNHALKIMASSRTPLKRVFPDPGMGSPAYNFLQPLGLGSLSNIEAREMLNHPWAPEAPCFDAATQTLLLTLAQGHPFKLQRAAHHRYEAMRVPDYAWQVGYQQDVEQML